MHASEYDEVQHKETVIWIYMYVMVCTCSAYPKNFLTISGIENKLFYSW